MRTPETDELPSPHWSYGFLIPRDPRAASVVRAAVRAILSATRLGCVADTVELLASELVTNAYHHSPSDAYVSVEHTPDALTVSVWDHGTGTPAPSQRGDDAESGRGLAIVEACADEWGVREYPHGNAVWFSVAPKANGDEACAVHRISPRHTPAGTLTDSGQTAASPRGDRR
ncbi:ATP-binding protein [Streptomyces phyllanthi]|uniref:ATP-binding protein n=1 Tax=Streptomyces phyllanthi TaxID=1803180 RepID=A0A5N8W1I4_9ACTN|nr:ATP-binding protein [Streptomyces phyllanthi]MPY41383.1 ATP-binding protein [Streptomyces phyllanthi]